MAEESPNCVAVCRANEKNEQTKKKPVTIRASLFFDGTGNNQTNTAHRLSNDQIYKSNHAFSESYDNAYSNVSKLSNYLLENSPGFNRHFKIYIEGIGTQNGRGDIPQGLVEGRGLAGIKVKVDNGLKKLLDLVDKVDNPDMWIQNLRLDVIGFSRGAAAARYCIYKALTDPDSKLSKRIAAKNYKIDKVEVCFAGLFDTVASYGFDITDDTEDLKLDSVAKAASVLHLTAADEYREHFPLTDIKSKGSKEISLPGVHSDIGGGYCDNLEEKNLQVLDIDSSGLTSSIREATRKRLAADKQWLLTQGWCSDEKQIVGPNFFNELKINRTGLRNTYSRIPLHIMATWAAKQGLNFNKKLDISDGIPKSDATLTKIYSVLTPDGTGNWKTETSTLKALRSKYFHFSAYYGALGMAPRFDTGNVMTGKRERKVYPG
ncbi:MAG: DUF2235 domain-containing protein [Bacteroidetes bacterium]|nr:DUF2235 domain-containing protein [Bacteroidota bacterium]